MAIETTPDTNLLEQLGPTLIFLDVDGVLNDHRKWPTRYSPIQYELVAFLNVILRAAPEAKIVLSSSWRYTFSTVPVIEHVLMCHGCECFGRIAGATLRDEEVHDGPMPGWEDKERWGSLGLSWRAEQIRRYVEDSGVKRFVVLDDLPLAVPNLVQTDGDVGLTASHAARAIEVLKSGVIDRWEVVR